MAMKRVLAVAAALAAPTQALVIQQGVAANPIRKVVNMLQAMQKKVGEEGEREEELYKKFMCYCKTGSASLKDSIAGSEANKPIQDQAISDAEAKAAKLATDIAGHEADRSDAKSSVAAATAQREKEAAAFAAGKTDDDDNIAAIKAAIVALEQGMAGSFLQAAPVQRLQRLAASWSAERQQLVSFLSEGAGYVPQSGEVVGILKQLLESFDTDRAAAMDAEKQAIAAFEALAAAKRKEIAAAGAAVEAKAARRGELLAEAERLKGELSAEQAAYRQDQAFLAELQDGCKTKTAEHEAHMKTRAEELVAIAETIKVLNDDDALDVFKKTLPSASALVEVRVSSRSSRVAAVRALSSVVGEPRVELIALALQGKKTGFEKIIGMIDELVASLKVEQGDDQQKKEYCGTEFDTADDRKKNLEKAVADGKAGMEDKKAAIAQTVADVQGLVAKIAALDKSVAEATGQRQAEHAEFTELMASDSTAKQLLAFAKNRLFKFYQPGLHVAKPKQVLSREDQIYVANGGEAPTTPAPGGIAGTGIGLLQLAVARAHMQVRASADPGPAPETAPSEYSTKSQESAGVIAMLDLLIKDLDKEMDQAQQEEKDSQAAYEKAMADSAASRAAEGKALTAKRSSKAQLEVELQDQTQGTAASAADLGAENRYIAALHQECDWLLKYFDVRKEARDGEITSLLDAKAVLSGASYSM